MKKDLYIILSLAYLEAMYHILAFSNINIIGPILSIVFLSFILIFIKNLFNQKVNKILFFILFFTITFIYELQFIYYKMIGFVCSVASLTMAGDAATGYENILGYMYRNWYAVLLLLLPFILLLIFNKKLDFEKKIEYKKLLYSLITYIIFVIYLLIGKNEIYSNYNLYYNLPQPLMITRKLGVLTELRLDIQRMLFGLDEKISPSKETKYDETYNILDIDFDKKTSVKKIDELNQYIKYNKATKKNEYTGIYKNKNVIFILAESLYPIAIDKELTPTLYKMTYEGFTFTNYYTPLYSKSTSDGEYMADWGLLPKADNESNLKDSMKNANPYMLVSMFNKNNYNTYAYHNYYGYFYDRKTYFQNLGFKTYKFCEDNIVKNCKMGDFFHASDEEMMKNTINEYINDDNFFVHYVTLSAHGVYKYDKNEVAHKYYDLVKDYDYPEELKVYLSANIDLDRGLEYLVNELEKKDKLKDTVFVITPDHYPYYLNPLGLDVLNLRSDENKNDKYNLHHSSLIIWNEKDENKNIDNYASNIDILPTMLNLFGFEYDSRLLIGKDILSSNDGLVIFSDNSWINKNGKYDANTDTFFCVDKCIVDKTYVDEINNYVKNATVASSLIQKYDYYKYIQK